MDAVSIEKFLATNNTKKAGAVTIHFKDRPTVTGIFINMHDYDELKAKNFWRVVNTKNLELWKQRKDINLSRLFNGAIFTRLSATAK